MKANEELFRAAGGRSGMVLRQMGAIVFLGGLSLLGNAFGAVAAPVLSPVEGSSLAKFTLTLKCTTSGTNERGQSLDFNMNPARKDPNRKG